MNLQEVNNITMTEGTVRTIHDSNGKLLWGKLTYSTTYDGDTEQDGTPTPASPVGVEVVTGSQTVTISDGTNTGSFTVNLGTTELCKIDNYQDYIYKSGDDWYVYKAIGKNESLNSIQWNSNGSQGDTTNGITFYYTGSEIPKVAGETTFYSNYFTQVPASVANTDHTLTDFMTSASAGAAVFNVKRSRLSTEDRAGFQSWLSQNGVVLYYPLATPTDTQITDATLISQLNSIHQFLTRYGYTGTVSGNLPLVINQTTLS